MYLTRCNEEVGEIEGLLTTGSSIETSGSESSSSEDESDESGYDDDNEK